jgi:RNA polymerase sigma factor (TIGR02999 family)
MTDEGGVRDTTQLLLAASSGEGPARAALFERLYDPLRELAHRQLRQAQEGALDTTELLHETYLKLCDAPRLSARDRAHFFALAARVMRQILVDHFRAGVADKRGGGNVRVALDSVSIPAEQRGEIVLAIDEALERLSTVSERTARVVELKFFGGLTEPDIAVALEVSERTVRREWRQARAWLSLELAAE